MSGKMLSPTMQSNLFTMLAASKVDPRQAISPNPYMELSPEQRLTRARLLLEETLETIDALGVSITTAPVESLPDYGISIDDLDKVKMELTGDYGCKIGRMNDVIDGCCDMIYVALGTLAAMGVPDEPHLAEVCRANGDKFPDGVATVDAHGKFQKPPGWRGTDHEAVRSDVVHSGINLLSAAEIITTILNTRKEHGIAVAKIAIEWHGDGTWLVWDAGGKKAAICLEAVLSKDIPIVRSALDALRQFIGGTPERRITLE